nr:Putative 2OG-Fe(II) oxygenase [uncultured Mediterranean phage uvMED]
MKTEVLNLWPIPLYKSIIEVNDDWLNYVKNIEYERNSVNNADMSKDYYILEKLPDLKSKIQSCVEDFTKNFLKLSDKFNFYFLNSWSNKHNLNDWSHSHYHGNSLISGVYYLNTPENSGNIDFVKNNLNNNMFSESLVFDYKEDNFINTESVRVVPKKGLILLFPSHLQHKVTRNKTNQTRYSIAFNMFVNGEFGNGEIMDLKL